MSTKPAFDSSGTMEEMPPQRGRVRGPANLTRRLTVTEITPATTICVNCGGEIAFVPAPPGLDEDLSYWSHVEFRRTWCYDPSGYLSPDVPLERRHLRADPGAEK